MARTPPNGVRKSPCHSLRRQTNLKANECKGKDMSKVAFLGLGVMGYPMAGHLAAKGHDVTVYNRTAAKAEA